MHKIFAKPLFLGKRSIFLPECHSSNDEMIRIARKENLPEGAVVYTDHQTKGRGQRGNIWADEPKKNLLASLYLKPNFLRPNEQYLLNLVIGLGVLDTINGYISGHNVVLKWPNDVYLNGRKVCGILIESSIKGETIESIVAGIGLNLNQKGFNVLSATSMLLETEEAFDRDDFLDDLLLKIENWYIRLKNGGKEEVIAHYHRHLMWNGELRLFKDKDGEFEGCINGIDNSGRLIVEVGGQNRFYTIKEITFLN